MSTDPVYLCAGYGEIGKRKAQSQSGGIYGLSFSCVHRNSISFPLLCVSFRTCPGGLVDESLSLQPSLAPLFFGHNPLEERMDGRVACEGGLGLQGSLSLLGSLSLAVSTY